MKVTWRRMKWKENFQELPVHVGIMKRGKQVGIWGDSRAKKGRFRRALRLDAGRCGLPLHPSALHHSSCGLDTPAPRIRRCGGSGGLAPRIRRCGGNGGLAPRIRRCGDNSDRPLSESTPWRQQRPGSRSRHRGGARARRSRILALLRIRLLWTRYRGGPNASCPTTWLSGPNASCPIPWLQP